MLDEDSCAGLMSLYEEKLRQWPVPFEAFFVATRYGKTHVIASGDPASPPVVRLHPEATSALAWSPMFAALIERYRIYAPDTIGDVGRSELDDFDVYPKKGGDFSAWLDDVHSELGIARADVVGGSMGGWVAMHRAVNAPDSTRSTQHERPHRVILGGEPWRSGGLRVPRGHPRHVIDIPDGGAATAAKGMDHL
jgi:pimeloyl-ACP methyl ester carboxylesterase